MRPVKVVKSTRSFKIGNVGVARQSQAGQITAEAIQRGANQFSQILFERARVKAEERGIEMAGSIGQDELYATGADGKKDPHARLEGASLFSMGGSIQRKAYQQHMSKRFETSIQSDLQERSGVISAKVDGQPNSVQQYETLMSDYVAKVAEQVPAEFVGTATDNGALILASRKASLFASQEARRRQKVKDDAAKHLSNLASAAQALGQSSAIEDTNSSTTQFTPFHKSSAVTGSLDASTSEAIASAASEETGDPQELTLKAYKASVKGSRSVHLSYVAGQLETLVTIQSESSEGVEQISSILNLLMNPHSEIAKVNARNAGHLNTILSGLQNLTVDERASLVNEIAPESKSAVSLINQAIAFEDQANIRESQRREMDVQQVVIDAGALVTSNSVGVAATTGKFSDLQTNAVEKINALQTQITKYETGFAENERRLGSTGRIVANTEAGVATIATLRRELVELKKQFKQGLQKRAITQFSLDPDATPKENAEALNDFRADLISGRVISAMSEKNGGGLLNGNQGLNIYTDSSIDGLSLDGFFTNQQKFIDKQRELIAESKNDFLKLNGDRIVNSVSSQTGGQFVGAGGPNEDGSFIHNVDTTLREVISQLNDKDITEDSHPDFFARLQKGHTESKLVSLLGDMTAIQEFTPNEMSDVVSVLTTGQATDFLSGRFKTESGINELIQLKTVSQELSLDKKKTIALNFQTKQTAAFNEREKRRKAKGEQATLSFERVETVSAAQISQAKTQVEADQAYIDLIQMLDPKAPLPISTFDPVGSGADEQFEDSELQSNFQKRVSLFEIGQQIAKELKPEELSKFKQFLSHELALKKLTILTNDLENSGQVSIIMDAINNGDTSNLGKQDSGIALTINAALALDGNQTSSQKSLREHWKTISNDKLTLIKLQEERQEKFEMERGVLDSTYPMTSDMTPTKYGQELSKLLLDGKAPPEDYLYNSAKYLRMYTRERKGESLTDPEREQAQVGAYISTILANKRKMIPADVVDSLNNAVANLDLNSNEVTAMVELWKNIRSYDLNTGEVIVTDLKGLKKSARGALDAMALFEGQYALTDDQVKNIGKVKAAIISGEESLAEHIDLYAGVGANKDYRSIIEMTNVLLAGKYDISGKAGLRDDFLDYARGYLNTRQGMGLGFDKEEYGEHMKAFFDQHIIRSRTTLEANELTGQMIAGLSLDSQPPVVMQGVNAFVNSILVQDGKNNISPILDTKVPSNLAGQMVASLPIGGSDDMLTSVNEEYYLEGNATRSLTLIEWQNKTSGTKQQRADLVPHPNSTADNPIWVLHISGKSGGPEIYRRPDGSAVIINPSDVEFQNFNRQLIDNRKTFVEKKTLLEAEWKRFSESKDIDFGGSGLTRTEFVKRQQQPIPVGWEDHPITKELMKLNAIKLKEGNGVLNQDDFNTREVQALFPSNMYGDLIAFDWVNAASKLSKTELSKQALVFEAEMFRFIDENDMRVGDADFNNFMDGAWYVLDKKAMTNRLEEAQDIHKLADEVRGFPDKILDIFGMGAN